MDGPPPPLTAEQLAFLPHDDRGPALIATSWCLTIFASVFLALRIYCKFLARGRRGLWWDDWILVAAWALLVIDASLATHMVVRYKYGVHIWDWPVVQKPPAELDAFVMMAGVRATITITAIAWTKTAFAITLLRLTEGWVKKALWFIIVTVNVSLGLSAMIYWIQCTEPLAKSWTPSIKEGKCWLDMKTIEHYNLFSGSYSAACDFVLALLPWTLLVGLQMKRPEKIGVGVAMSMGFLAGIAAIVKTVKLPNLSDPDIYVGVELVIWDITEVAVSMVGACIPVLRVLIRQVRTVNSSRGRVTGASSKYGLGSGLNKEPKPRPPSWLPGWKATSQNGASAVAFTGSKSKGLSPTSTSQTREPGEFEDDWSEMSVLVPPPNASLRQAAAGERGILRTQDIRIESRRQSPRRVDDDDKMFEMGKVSPV